MRSVQRSAGSHGHLPSPVLMCPSREAHEMQSRELLAKQLYRGVCQSLGFSVLASSRTRWVQCRDQQPGRGQQASEFSPCQQAE